MLGSFSKAELCFTLCRFVHEVKKLDGTEYPLNTLREIVICIQMFLNEYNVFWKLFDHHKFIQLRNVVDNTMKERHNL